MRNSVRRIVAFAAVACGVALVTVLPGGPTVELRTAVAAGSCPITVRIHATTGIGASIADASRTVFEASSGPGTTLQVTQTGDNEAAIYDLAHHTADIAVTNRPLTQNELLFKYEWQLASHLWASTNDIYAVNRIDNSAQVRADDWINIIRNPYGVSIVAQYANVAVPPAARAPFTDADVNLNGIVDLGDVGGVASKWGATSSCTGWIRADTNNYGRVSISSVGGVFQHWNQDGLVCNAGTGCCSSSTNPLLQCDWTAMFADTLGLYVSGDASCAHDGDPITLVVRMADSDAVVQQHLSEHGLPHDNIGGLYEENAYFDDLASCQQSEINRGSGSSYELFNWPVGDCNHPVCILSRWHARGHQNSAADPQYAGVRDYAFPPHRDEVSYNCGQYAAGVDGKHYVPLGGYESARNFIYSTWLASGHHVGLTAQKWNNTAQREQCDAAGNHIQAHSNGWVFMLGQCGEVASC